MSQQKNYCCTIIIILLASLFFPWYNALEFDVGGNDGWVLNPSENYKDWTGRMRFQINDTLLFWYDKGRDSVLEVKEDDYEKCNTKNPIKKMDDGYSVMRLHRSGPFYFISGNQQNCEKGQKINVVVLSMKNGCSSNTTSGQATPPRGSIQGPPPAATPPPRASPTVSPSPTPTVTPHKGCTISPPSGGSPPTAPPKGSSSDVPTPSFNAPPKPPATSVSPIESPQSGDGCDNSDIRSDPANVHKPPDSSPPKSASATPATIHLSAILVSTLILAICVAF